MFRHAIKFDYFANNRIEYYSNHKRAKQFLLLQRRIRYFLFMKKVKILEQMGVFNDLYIKTFEYRKKIKSKDTLDKYLSKPRYKFHMPISKIIKIQKNYRAHLKYIKKMPKHNIDKFSLNKCPLIIKEIKLINFNNEILYKNIKIKVANQKKDFYVKLYYNYTPLYKIQRKYKERYKYLEENYKLKKHEKIRKKVANKHHYIYHSTIIDGKDKILLIQKNIKYFLYRKHAIVNLIPKIKIPKCVIRKSYSFRESIKEYFYEEFAKRITFIIRKYFLSYYFKIIKSNFRYRKNSNTSFNLNNSFYEKRNSYKDFPNLQFINPSSFGKETFNFSPKRPKPIILNKGRQSNLINNDSNSSKDKGNKKKVSFKNDFKRTDSKKFGQKDLGDFNDLEPIKKFSSKKIEINKAFIRKKTNFGNK